MHLRCKDWKGFWCKQRLQKCPNAQVTTIFARSPKTRIFWKSIKGVPSETFQKSPEKNPSSERPKSTLAQMAYPLNSMLLNCKDWKTFWRKQRLQKCPNGQVMPIFASSPKSRIFWKSANGGPREIFQKSPKKMPSLKRPKSTLAQMALSSN